MSSKLTVEEMARELASKNSCISGRITGSASFPCAPHPYELDGCTECRLKFIDHNEITAKYEELMKQAEDLATS